jgi:hypothetical protein
MITMKMNIAKAISRMDKMPGKLDATLRPWLVKNARTLVSSTGQGRGMVQATPPFDIGSAPGKTSEAKKIGEAAVARDIKRVYGDAGALYAKIKTRDAVKAAQFWKLVNAQQWTAANNIAEPITGFRFREFDDGARHKQRRNRRGRVTGKDPDYFVTNFKHVENYIKAKQKLVGLLSATAVSEGTSIFGSLSGVPAWVKRHSPAWATIKETNDNGKRKFTYVTRPPYALSELQRWFDIVLDTRKRLMKLEFPHVIRAAAKAEQLANS